MSRPTRTYKLLASPAGFDLIVESHTRLVRVTRTLLPYGAALNTALELLSGLDPQAREDAVSCFPRYRLAGGRDLSALFVGAPKSAARIVDRLQILLDEAVHPETKFKKTEIYLLAFHAVAEAEPEELLAAYGRVASKAGQFDDLD